MKQPTLLSLYLLPLFVCTEFVRSPSLLLLLSHLGCCWSRCRVIERGRILFFFWRFLQSVVFLILCFLLTFLSSRRLHCRKGPSGGSNLESRGEGFFSSRHLATPRVVELLVSRFAGPPFRVCQCGLLLRIALSFKRSFAQRPGVH